MKTGPIGRSVQAEGRGEEGLAPPPDMKYENKTDWPVLLAEILIENHPRDIH